MNKIVLITNSSSVFFYFRKELVFDLKKNGFDVIGIVGDEKYVSEIKSWGVQVFTAPLKNRNKNIFSFYPYKRKLEQILRSEMPNMVITFQTKPNIFGIRAAKKAGINKVFSMVEGLGDGFSGKGIKGKIVSDGIRLLYKKSLPYACGIFVLNKEDEDFLEKQCSIPKRKMILINGTGIDCSAYPQRPFTNFKTATMVSRLIAGKGVFVFAEAARICHKKRPDLIFKLIGSESEITKNDLKSYIEDGSILYLGPVGDLKTELQDMTISIVPSFYLEGMPRAIMEAMATGRPVITTNTRGCNAAIQNGVTGLLVQMKNPNDLAEKIIELFSNQRNIILYGQNARDFAEKNFDSHIIDKTVIDSLKN